MKLSNSWSLDFRRDRQQYKALRGTCLDMCPEKVSAFGIN